MTNDATDDARALADPADPPIEGVRGLDHTADIGIEVEAPSLAELFRRAALTSIWLVLERPASDRTESRAIRVTAPDLSMLMRSWIREILRLLEEDGFAAATILEPTVQGATEERFEEGVTDESVQVGATVEATVEGGPSPSEPVREIKGVTLHGLVVDELPERDPEGRWFARVIFDV